MSSDDEKPAPKKRGRKPVLSADKVAEEVAKRCGNLSSVARAFGVKRASLQGFINARPALQAALQDARERQLDEAESALYKAARKGEGWAVCFFLKTQGRSRGYLENAVLLDLQQQLATLNARFESLVQRGGNPEADQ